MPIDDVSDLLGRVFRVGEAYDLIVFDRLRLEEQALLAELRDDPDAYGVLRPREGSGRTYRAIGKDSALLLLTLREPGPLPFFVWSGDSRAAANAVADMVLDGVLEIEHDGQFVTGTAAAALFAREPGAPTHSRQAQLSRDALIYGQALEMDNPDQLASRLYAFGRRPVTATVARQFRDDASTLSWLGAEPGSALRAALDREWRLAEGTAESGWFSWNRPAPRGRRASSAVYKLYISPDPSDTSKALSILVDRLGRRPGMQFKIGRTAEGLMRPDKMVAYFDTLDDLLDAADDLASALKGISAHGVPFSAEITPDGLLSWGMDPPHAERALTWQGPESWRLWVVRRLASAMIAAQSSAETSMSPWQFAVDRIRRQGVDTERWTPSAAIWSVA